MLTLPVYLTEVAAGFPSPADDHMQGPLDLNELLISHPSATFFLRVNGTAMVGAAIHHQDILVVDRSLSPAPGKIVVAIVNGELMVRRLCRKGKKLFLTAESQLHAPIEIGENLELQIWGIVTSVIHRL
jgi:DNA polymerase V